METGIHALTSQCRRKGRWSRHSGLNRGPAVYEARGTQNRPDVNQTFLQPFTNYNLGAGLSVGVSVEATGNWSADQPWTAPLLFSVSKVTLLGTRPVNLALAAGPLIASPDAGASWRFRLAATFLFPR